MERKSLDAHGSIPLGRLGTLGTRTDNSQRPENNSDRRPLRHHSGDSNNYLMPSHRHQSSLEAILDFWEPFSLTPQQASLARRLLDILVEDYGLEREIEKRYKPAKLIYTMLELVLSKDSFLTLFFTFLHEHLTSGPSNITLALSYFEDIGTWEPAARNDVASALEEFAHYMITQFFLPLRASSVKTPQPTPTSSLSTIQASTPTSTKRRISALRHDCLVRDHHRCVVTRKFDITEARKRIAIDKNCTDDDGRPLKTEQRGNFQYLEIAHILPHCLTKVASGDEDLVGIIPATSSISLTGHETESKKNILRILDIFDPGITHFIDGANIDSPSNALTLTLDNHRLLGEFKIYFEPTGGAYEYRIHSTDDDFLSDPFFPVTRTLMLSPNRTIDPPSPRLLGIHRAICLILKLSGAAEYIEHVLRDLELVTVEADGSTHVGDIIRLRIDGWISAF
ncbi:hypothetical protein TMEN_9518 [Trichophyton mentagrophytes]|nr:hypothetical protein TMEN_9518 [Trichophyton mentagrophytes]